MWNIIISLSTRINEYERTNKHDNIKHNVVYIKCPCHRVHELFFNNSKWLSIIFKSKSFMLIVNKTAPAPEWQAHFLPARKMLMVVIMIMFNEIFLNLIMVHLFFIRFFFKSSQTFDIFFICNTIPDICYELIHIKHS